MAKAVAFLMGLGRKANIAPILEVINMTRFEERGINRQYNACNIREARIAFETSCEICATQGKFINCDRCAIAYVNQLVTEIFAK